MGDRLDHLGPNLAGLRVQFGWRAEVCASRKWLGIVDSARARLAAQQLADGQRDELLRMLALIAVPSLFE